MRDFLLVCPAITPAWGEGRSEHFPEIMAEFVRLKVSVIVMGNRRRHRGKMMQAVQRDDKNQKRPHRTTRS
jgi:hypothetical protein